jgi:hypothetical protein
VGDFPGGSAGARNEGVNLQIEYRGVEGNAARLPEVAADLVRLKPDLIATRGSFFTGALKAATSSIPIVFVTHADPVGTGHVASLARPGGSITGMAVLLCSGSHSLLAGGASTRVQTAGETGSRAWGWCDHAQQDRPTILCFQR